MAPYVGQVQEQESDGAGNDRTLSVLCVYSEGSNAAIATVFEDSDVPLDITVVATIQAAVGRFETEDIDCIVSAAQLPDGDGLQFLQTIRADNPDLPFFLYTDADAADIASDAIAAGVTDYVVVTDDEDHGELTMQIQHAVAQYRASHNGTTSTDRARTVLAAAPDAIVVVVDDSIVWANPEATILLGAVSETELYGTTLDALEPPDTADVLSRALASARESQTPVEQTDTQIETLDGERRVVELTAREVEWESETGVVAILRDIGESATRRELQERNSQLEAILNTASAAIFTKDAEGRYLLANDTFRDIIGVHDDRDITGLTDEDLFPEDIARELRRADQRAFDAGESVEVEEVVPAPDKFRPFLTRKTPLFDDEGEPHALVAVATDITTQKEREHELRERVKELSAVHRTVELFDSESGEFEATLQEFVETLPQSFQYPDRTAVRIQYGDTIVTTEKFVSDEPRLQEETETADSTTIELEVVLTDRESEEEPPWQGAEAPFLEEEYSLVETLLAVVAGYAEREEQFTELERYETTLKALGDPVYALDRNGNLTFVNNALVERTGYDREELLDEHISTFITDASVERGLGVIRGLLSADTRATARWKMELVTVDGEHIPCENHVALLPFDEDGSFRGTAGVIRDVSDQKEREQALQRSRDHLLRTEEIADVGGWELDVESDELRWTNGTHRIHEVSDEYEPTLADALTFYHPEDRQRVKPAIEECREYGTPFDIEVRLVTAEGRERWLQTRGERVEENGSTILRGTVQDVTDAKESEQQLMVLNRVLRHNLRNNLNVVTANTELLSDAINDVATTLGDTDQSPTELLSRLETIEKSAWELKTLAEKARQLSETIEQTDATETVALSPLVTDLVDSYREEYPDATITLDDNGAEVLGNRSAVQLALGEILDNAFVHSEGDPDVTIDVTRRSTDRVQIRVADDGPGVPEMERKALEQGAETALEHGSGLGLWTVNWLSARLGGSVNITDNEPTGTVVTLELPAA